MRFMMIVKTGKNSEAGKMPSQELIAAMGKYNEELMKAGVLAVHAPAPHGEDVDSEIEIRQVFELERELAGRKGER